MNQNNRPLISVIIPCYNPKIDFFKEATESVLAQSYNNWEAIIVNDGSSEESTQALESYIKKLNDNRFSTLHLDKNCGPAFAKNKGIEVAKGEIITFLDTDDIHLPWYYEQITNQFNQNPNSSILATHELHFLGLFLIKKIVLFHAFNNKEESEIKNYLKLATTPRLVIKREIFKTIRFDPDILNCEDTDLCFQILDNVDLLSKVSFIPINGYLYRIYSSGKRLTHDLPSWLKATNKIIKKYKDKESIAGKAIRDYKILDHLETKNLFLIPFFGIRLLYPRILFNFKNDIKKITEKQFINYLIVCKDEKTKFYADKLYKRLF